MKRRIKIISITILTCVGLLGGLNGLHALDTVVVGQPYYYGVPYYGYGAYGPYAPIAFPGLYGANPNPALQRRSAASPFFLGNQVQRATGINTQGALNKSGFIFYAPQTLNPGFYPY